MTTKFEDLRQSEEWATYLTCIGWQVRKFKVQSSKFKIFIREIPLIGSVAKIQRPSVIPPIEEIDKIAKKHHTLFIKLEPHYQQPTINNQQFAPDNWPLAPTRTVHLDLGLNEEEIFARFSKDARYSVRKARRDDVEARSLRLDPPEADKGLKTFYALLKEVGERKKFWVPPEADLQAKAEAFKDKSALILAYHDEEPVAGALILFHDNVAYYHHAASSLEGRQLLAPYLIVWEAIKLAKKRNCHTLDLEGIYDPRYKIYRRFRKIGVFKKKFGGKEVLYPGSFIRYYNPLIKLIFKLTSRP